MFNPDTGKYEITPEQKVELRQLNEAVETQRMVMLGIADSLRMARRRLREAENAREDFLHILLEGEPGPQILRD